MTQPPDLPGLPPEEESVRRLLADARHDGPAPADVVARLDATLAELAAEREGAAAPATTTPSSASPTHAPVVDLGARRRRMAGVGLLAAAAVVVAGVAIGSGLPSMSGGSDDSGSASAGDVATSRELGDSSAGGAASEDGMSQQPKAQLSPGLLGYPELFTSDDDLDDELVRLRDAPAAAPEASGSTRARDCAVPGAGRGRRVVAELDGALGLVVFRRSDGATQQVDLYLCGDPAVVRTLTLPAP
jgi:hypothetical protein